jgi:hypothetical protein
MDEQLQQLEQELKRLHPVQPSPRLQEGIRRELLRGDGRNASRPARGPTWAGGWWWIVALPAAAAVAVMLTQRSTPPAADTAARPGALARRASGDAVFKPVQAENILYAASNEGLITLEDGTPARRERLHYVDTITWRNPRTNASLTWSVPREEVRVVPVELH